MYSDVFHLRLHKLELQAERLIDPSIRSKPVAIISTNTSEGKIIQISKEAYYEGFYVGMKLSIAKKIGKRVWFLPYNNLLYKKLTQHLCKTILSFTPVIESENFGSIFLDMHGIPMIHDKAINIGKSILKDINQKLNIKGSLGISINKLVSQIITSSTNEKIQIVNYGDEKNFLCPLSTKFLPIINEKRVKTLLDFLAIKKIKDIQDILPYEEQFKTIFGLYASRLKNEITGKDVSVVRSPLLKEHLIEQRILPEDTNDYAVLEAVIQDLAENIGFKLREKNKAACLIRLELIYADAVKKTSIENLRGIDNSEIIKVCSGLFDKLNIRRNRIRSIIVDAHNFHSYAEQEELFNTKKNKDISISNAIDSIRNKYGIRSLQAANVLGLITLKNK